MMGELLFLRVEKNTSEPVKLAMSNGPDPNMNLKNL